MKVTDIFKTGCLALVLGIGLFICGAFSFSSFDFYFNSAEVEGQIIKITSSNDRCRSGGRRTRRSYDCTEYTAAVNYATPQGIYTVNISAGSARGHNQSISQADYQIGQKVKILYDTRNPTSAYPNTFMDIWGGLLMALAFPFFFILKYLNNLKEWYAQFMGE